MSPTRNITLSACVAYCMHLTVKLQLDKPLPVYISPLEQCKIYTSKILNLLIGFNTCKLLFCLALQFYPLGKEHHDLKLHIFV